MEPYFVDIKELLKIRVIEKGWQTPSKIQEEMIPLALDGNDILAIAPTGSGKTGAFLIPALNTLEPNYNRKHMPRVLIVSPTRELCLQIAEESRSLLQTQEGIRTTCLTGGVDIQKQIRSFKNGADIVVGTPSRILDHIRRHTLKTKDIDFLIIDEADEMLTMGFLEDVQSIASKLKQHQTILTSATFNKDLEGFALSILNDPKRIEIKQDSVLSQNIDLTVIDIPTNKKNETVFSILNKEDFNNAIIFTNTIKTSEFVKEQIYKNTSYSVCSIHSDMDPKTRLHYMKDFKDGTTRILCATDVAARGIDIKHVDLVILYDYPDRKEFLKHRVGRTGRANKAGSCYILLSNKQDKEQEIASLLKLPFKKEVVKEDKPTYNKKRHNHSGSKNRRKTNKRNNHQ